jgi:PAS domain S-box-containing protein
VPYFICPNCKNRSIDHDRRESLTDPTAVGCHRCGFGFLFELMEDYYPGPETGMIVCDAEGRVLATGRGVFELTGFQEHELMGQEVVDVLRIEGFANGQDPFALALEWGVRRLEEHCELTAAGGRRKDVTADIFPAYDDDGGLLVALSPRLGS